MGPNDEFLAQITAGGASAVLQRSTIRAFDMTLALLLLLWVGPLMLLSACAVKLDSPGPVLVRDPATGCLRFRTQHLDSHELSRIGTLLWMARLDEVPQIFDVIGGRSSFFAEAV